jgi:hypothetical protein
LNNADLVIATLADTIALHERVKQSDLQPVLAAAAAIVDAVGSCCCLATAGARQTLNTWLRSSSVGFKRLARRCLPSR